VDGFRAFAIGHPGLFRIGIQLTETLYRGTVAKPSPRRGGGSM